MSALGHPRVHLRRTDSTNDRARELARAGAPHGTLVTAGEQTAGRGRGGRSWSAPPGSSVLMSLLLRRPPSLLPLMAALAVCDVAGVQARIKWPNDVVFVEGGVGATVLAKLAGILTEGRPQEGWAVTGIGLNVAVRLEDLPAELRPGGAPVALSSRPAATLGRSPAEVEPTLTRLLAALEQRLRESPEATLEAWRSRDVLRGREIAWDSGEGASRGLAHGIDGSGRLVVELAGGGRTTLSAGEVHLVAMPV
jgi:BirA family biotin operon repressor/biotin-[acetyl-CoA-carboxylase] ligase